MSRQRFSRVVGGVRLRACVAAVALGVALVAAHAQGGAESVEPCGDAVQVREWIDGLNARRGETTPCVSNVPVSVLHWEKRLASSAQDLAVSLAHRGSLSHVDGAGRTLAQRLQVVGYRPAAAAENLAAGQPTFADALEAWMNSPAHCANVMRADITEVGIACVRSDDNPYRWFWVAQFGRPSTR